MGTPARAVAYAADALVAAGPCTLRGWSLRDTGGTGTVVAIRDTGGAGAILGEIVVAANGAATEGDLGVYAPGGVYVDNVSGTAEGAIYIA